MDEADFIAAVLAAPDDDTPRRAYAAWLTARGHWRGEFITAQLDAVEDWQAEGAARAMLSEERLANLLPGPGISRPIWRRGFLESVVMQSRTFLAMAPALFAQHPLQELSLFSPLDVEDATAIAAQPLVARLKRLRLGPRTSVDAFAAILASPHLGAGVEDLYVADTPLGDEGAQALAASSWVRLRKLDLCRCEIGVGGALALAGSRVLETLTELSLAGNPIAAGARALAGSPHLEQLRTLVLSKTSIGSRHAAAFAEVASLRGLEALDLAENSIADEGAVALANCRGLANLRRLDLRRNLIGAAGAQALAAGPGLPRLETLGLTGNSIFSDKIETWIDWDGAVVGEGAVRADAGWLYGHYGGRFRIE
jgi:uncharacterized protein (TIGR02996 family)